MKRRLTLTARLLLILLSVLMLLATLSVLVLHVKQRKLEAVGYDTRYPRVAQVAATVDLLANAAPSQSDAIVRAANGVDLAARLSQAPPSESGFEEAARLEAQLARLSLTHTPIRAYTNPLFRPRDPSARVEGFLARAVARLPDGRYLLMQAHRGLDEEQPRFFNVGASLWIGGMALMLTLTALWAVGRETRPLRDLVRAVGRFEGKAVTVTSPAGGAEDIRRTSLAVITMQERVIELLGERSLVIGAISHDLRTLLTKMRLRVASITDQKAQAALDADLEGMEAMLADGLAFARGTAGGVTRVRLDLADLVATELADRQARREEVSIDAVLEDTPMNGDPHALRRVVANLMDNAVKYGGGRIRISTVLASGHATLIVEDDGPGIRPEQREAMMRPYGRGDHPGGRGLAGSGLGLAIVQQIVRGHVGSVTISVSELGGAMIITRFAVDAGAKDAGR